VYVNMYEQVSIWRSGLHNNATNLNSIGKKQTKTTKYLTLMTCLLPQITICSVTTNEKSWK